MPIANEQQSQPAVYMDQDRFLPIANIGRIMKNTLEPVRDSKLKRPSRSKKEAKGLPKQTPYEQYEESGSDEDGDVGDDVSGSELISNDGCVSDMFISSQMHTEGQRKAAKISREARETMQECVTEFLLFVTSEA